MKRVAVYTRQSVADDLEFGSIQAQREAVEAYVASQGWTTLAERYDDHGFSGANTDRPAFKRLLADVADGRVDLVAVHRIDRLSRSIADFGRIIELLQQHGTSFVSVTQSFDTSTPIGEFTLNILMSFAQFERQMIAERTRDKMAATRRRGEWTGGTPVLGYDLVEKRLVVNEAEAEQVREIFRLFIQLGSIGQVVTEVNARGFRTKQYGSRGGRPFTKATVRRILTCRLYRGEIEYEGEIHAGQHEGIIDQETWDAAQAVMTSRPRKRGNQRWTSVLGGLLKCGVCGSAYVHTYTSKGSTRYRYYVCDKAQKRGARACPGSRVPAKEIEDAVVEEVRVIGRDPSVIRATIAASRSEADRQVPRLEGKLSGLERDRARLSAEKTRVVDAIAGGVKSNGLIERLQRTERELTEAGEQVAAVRVQIAALRSRVIDEDDLRRALGQFDPIWEALMTQEKTRLLSLLVERITYGADTEELTIQLRPEGVRYLGATERRTA